MHIDDDAVPVAAEPHGSLEVFVFPHVLEDVVAEPAV
jgi:hypothetical protein